MQALSWKVCLSSLDLVDRLKRIKDCWTIESSDYCCGLKSEWQYSNGYLVYPIDFL